MGTKYRVERDWGEEVNGSAGSGSLIEAVTKTYSFMIHRSAKRARRT